MSKESTINDLHALYQECVNCPNTEKECPGIWRDTAKGVFPDGFYFRTIPADILVVGKNTGHPDERELEIFPGLTGDVLYKTLRAKQEADFQNGGLAASAQLFSRKLAEYLSYILDTEEKDLFRRIAFTNLVKCRTIVESGNKLHKDTMNNCFNKYLRKEVSLLRPKVILALGREPEVYLLRKSWRPLGVPVLYLKHTSRPLNKKDKSRVLDNLKEDINFFINKADG